MGSGHLGCCPLLQGLHGLEIAVRHTRPAGPSPVPPGWSDQCLNPGAEVQSTVVERKSAGDRTGIESAFLKGGTQINLLHIGAPSELARRLPGTQKIQIKLELDLRPPPGTITEWRTRLLPSPYQARLYDLPSLFAGKLHAVLCRGWKNRVKGRDFHDFVWYVSRGIRPNLPHLAARMRQSGHWTGDDPTPSGLRDLLRRRIVTVDFKRAAEDVVPFLHDPREVELWSAEFFLNLTEHQLALDESRENRGSHE
jgi:hypothetical protein